METMSDAFSDYSSYMRQGGEDGWDDDKQDQHVGFDRLDRALITLFQLLVGANWSALMFVAMSTLDSLWGVAAFFFSFVLLGNVLLLSLFAALTLEIYSVQACPRMVCLRAKVYACEGVSYTRMACLRVKVYALR